MGTTFGKPFAGLFQETEPRIVFFGLNHSGKSSILHQLKTGDTLSETRVVPVGYDVGSFKYKNSSFSCFEIGEQCMYRNISLWKNYFQRAAGFVFVVDNTYRERIEDAKSFLYMVMNEIKGNAPDNAAVLVYSNIHIVPGGAMSAPEISKKLYLASLRERNWQRNWHVQSSCTLCGYGVHEGFDWLSKNVERM